MSFEFVVLHFRRLGVPELVAASAIAILGCDGEPFTGGSGTTGGAGGETGTNGGSTSVGGAGGEQHVGGSQGDCEDQRDCADKPGTSCIEGGCLCPSTASTYCPGLGCIDTETDEAHCGGCGIPCVAGDSATTATCEAGLCNFSCAAGTDDCDLEPTTCETVTTDNPEHCGSCFNACGHQCAGDVCNDPVQITAGDLFTCATLSLGSVYCWGDNSWGQIGNDAEKNIVNPRLIAIPAGVSIERVESRGNGSCALSTTGQVVAWGASGGLAVPQLSPHHSGIQDISSRGRANNHGCWTINANNNAQESAIGYNTIDIPQPGQVDSKAAAGGGMHACVIRTGDEVFCGGDNESGQLGRNNFTTPLAMGAVVGLGDVKLLASGDAHTCATSPTDQLFCWGSNAWGQVGNAPAAPNSSVPQLLNVANVDHVELGVHHSAAIANGTLYLWGRNSNKQSSQSTATSIFVPTVYPGATNIDDVALGAAHTCYLKEGKVYCWGVGIATGHGQGATEQPLQVVLPQ
jgi:alpha-tubulin suppressor-like RCC1 family protein